MTKIWLGSKWKFLWLRSNNLWRFQSVKVRTAFRNAPRKFKPAKVYMEVWTVGCLVWIMMLSSNYLSRLIIALACCAGFESCCPEATCYCPEDSTCLGSATAGLGPLLLATTDLLLYLPWTLGTCLPWTWDISYHL